MKKTIPILLVLFSFTNGLYAQEKTNPIVFAEMILGYANGSSKGLTAGATVNYQSKDNLFTYRYLDITENRKEGDFFFIPIYVEVEKIKENALMYGKRTVEDNLSYSYSGGIAIVNRAVLIGKTNDVLNYETTNNIGFPFELNIKWFNAKKEKYRIYEIIPIGKPISFANSIGFKLYGNVSKTTFVGIGINFGLGWHKNY